ncbi:hypothetical protein QWY22_03650 [Planococcus liqunii]|uniref:hypothetical protein n=1 Tax=Planococcus liqunii TaxID=3058394 RepID=UPI002615B65E|nr:hypothetical protein [Planococcus sp. N056]WKA51711.1 hypothetical protein QWY22_03650 [Planococcus sp. N056]
MIKIKQGAIPNNLNLSNCLSAGYKETERAKVYFLSGPKPKKNFNFDAYRCDSLKKVFSESFNGKCAYCESLIVHIKSMEIEHYRPKKAIKIGDELIYPGYYWLAADFSNLLPSCPACNQLRRYELEDGTCVTKGKGNYFPLKCESERAKFPGEEINEQPLLLHPYYDKPHEHLTFLASGLIKLITDQGSASVDTYVLGRPELTRVRKELIIYIKSDIVSAFEAIIGIKEASNITQLHRHKKSYYRHYNNLRRRMRSSSPYAAAARNIIHPIVRDLKKEFKKTIKNTPSLIGR